MTVKPQRRMPSLPDLLTREPWPRNVVLRALIGLFNPLMREIGKMRYLWDNPMRLADSRLDGLLGPDFGTPYNEAMAATVRPMLAR